MFAKVKERTRSRLFRVQQFLIAISIAVEYPRQQVCIESGSFFSEMAMGQLLTPTIGMLELSKIGWKGSGRVAVRRLG